MELAQECSTYPNIPNDIFLEILLKLPIKSLLRFRSLSKYHKSLISHPSFILQRRQPESNNLFLHISSNPKYKSKRQARFSLLKLDDASRRPLTITECPRPEYHTVKATCAGVVLLSDSEYHNNTFMLWNPSTRKETKLRYPDRFSCSWYNHGLCHDPATGDFKVVLASFDLFAVYSCNHNYSWTQKKRPLHTRGNKAGTFVDGAIYWAVSLDWQHPNRSDEIVYFDMRDDEFKKLEMPGFCKDEFNLVALRGCLCLYEHTGPDKTEVRVWMKEKGVDKNGWDELMTIENINVEEPSHEWFRVVCLLDDDDDDKILLQLREFGGFVVYSIRDKTFEGFGEMYDPLFRVELVPYRESMLFPHDNLIRSKRKRSQPLKLKI